MKHRKATRFDAKHGALQESRVAHQRLVDTLKTRGLPPNVWQVGLYNDSLLKKPRNEITDPGDGVDLIRYIESYQFCEVQPEFFLFILPELVRVWGGDLMGEIKEYAGCAEHVMSAFAAKPPFPTFLNEEQYEALSDYVAALILERMSKERLLHLDGLENHPRDWFYAQGSFAGVFPHLARIWDRWWAMEEESMAVCALQYMSCLMYEKDDNPIFEAWTPEKGGGPPCLWGCDGHIFEQSTHPDNVAFLEQTLTIDFVRDALARAQKFLAAPENQSVASKMLADFDEQLIFLDDHIEKLPRALRRPKADVFSWDDL